MTNFTVTEDFPKSEIEFDQRFRDSDACYNYLASIKWSGGFMCDECGHKNYWLSSQYIYICTRCEHQHSLTAGTIMHATKKPITNWFMAMWWITTRKSGVSAVNLQELAIHSHTQRHTSQPTPGFVRRLSGNISQSR